MGAEAYGDGLRQAIFVNPMLDMGKTSELSPRLTGGRLLGVVSEEGSHDDHEQDGSQDESGDDL